MKRILIVEDDKEINGLLYKLLEENHYNPQSAFTGMDGLNMLSAETYDLVLLDIMLPFKSGDEILRELRKSSNTPVIMITAKDLTQTKVELLRLGADDYITKPFDIDEVLARIEAALRRYSQVQMPSNVLLYQNITMDCEAKRVTVSSEVISLTVTEYAILELLMKNPTKIFSKRNLFESISGAEYLGDDNTINVHISNIRHKLQNAGKYIETVYGMGYRLAKN
ncbi:MAG: response regulator transcription factor [Lachnospiraceae bacterium]